MHDVLLCSMAYLIVIWFCSFFAALLQAAVMELPPGLLPLLARLAARRQSTTCDEMSRVTDHALLWDQTLDASARELVRDDQMNLESEIVWCAIVATTPDPEPPVKTRRTDVKETFVIRVQRSKLVHVSWEATAALENFLFGDVCHKQMRAHLLAQIRLGR